MVSDEHPHGLYESHMIREATLLDILGVLADMDLTQRGQDELAQWRLLSDAYTKDQIAAQMLQQSRFIYAFVDEREPQRALAVAGFIPMRTGVLRTWMLATDAAWELYGLELTKATADGLQHAQETAHRIEAICLNSHHKAHRWYARIGLQKETTLTRYCTDGTDAALFVMTRSEQ